MAWIIPLVSGGSFCADTWIPLPSPQCSSCGTEFDIHSSFIQQTCIEYQLCAVSLITEHVLDTEAGLGCGKDGKEKAPPLTKLLGSVEHAQ